MKPLLVGSALAAALIANLAFAQTPPFVGTTCDPRGASFVNVRLPQAVLADGKALTAGTYQLRVTTEHPAPAVGQSGAAECWVEFVKNGSVAGREIASVVSAEDIGTITKGPPPQPNGWRVDALKGGEHIRVWINSAGTHYIVNLPVTP